MSDTDPAGQPQESAKRPSAADPPAMSREDGPPPKRQKTSIHHHLICCITLSLPWDPVTAMDGSVYERWAIEEYFSTKRTHGEVKSPAKGIMMGRALLPAPHIKSIIETSIENGTITGDLADKWKEKAKKEKDKNDLRKKAEGGHVESMEDIAICYYIGSHGFKKDQKEAYNWYKKAHDAGSVVGMGFLGHMLMTGSGVEKDSMKGRVYLGAAAALGSAWATATLGMNMADGRYGFPVDKAKARLLLEKAISGGCACQNLGATCKETAQKRLDKLMSENCAAEETS